MGNLRLWLQNLLQLVLSGNAQAVPKAKKLDL
jgi:hypothetical protein